MRPIATGRFSAARLEAVFDGCFAEQWNTRLLGGAEEPLYSPATHGGASHRLYYRLDYFASALHEVAHWCIAGTERLQQQDFGYWYAPEGRDIVQQRAFEQVESKPQALEWLFSRACGYRFRVSVDNLHLASQGALEVGAFQDAVLQQALAWQHNGLPPRARVFYSALCREFGTCTPADRLRLALEDLQ